jgi:hypothetical protein
VWCHPMSPVFHPVTANSFSEFELPVFDYQLAASAHILANLFGRIPVNRVPDELKDDDNAKMARNELRRCRMEFTFLCDLPGLGKVVAYLMTFQWIAIFGPTEEDTDGSPLYRGGTYWLQRRSLPR